METVKDVMATSHVHPERIRGRRVAVLGLARTGGAVSRMLLSAGAEVLASDRGDTDRLQQNAEQLRDLGAWVELGRHTADVLARVDFVVPSPGIAADHPVLVKARTKGVPVFSEIEVAFWLHAGDVLAVTGTNGKTTTATLLHHMLKQDGLQARLAGNVGLAYSAIAAGLPEPVVLEVSSYQLEYTETFRPIVSGILNITPDHLERHGDLAHYAAAKFRIVENQCDGDTVVLNADCPTSRELRPPPGVHTIYFSTTQFLPEGVYCDHGNLVYRTPAGDGVITSLDRIRLPGAHNLANAAAAAAMALAYGAAPESIAGALAAFEGVPHRLEPLGTRRGRRVINDSKATNVGAMCMALDAVAGPIVLLVGGRAKGDDPADALSLLSQKARAVIAYGEARAHFQRAWQSRIQVDLTGDLRAAVERAFAISRPGDAVLLSPACASFDQFNDFEERGDRFREYVDEFAG